MRKLFVWEKKAGCVFFVPPLQGLLVVQLDKKQDARGFFCERYQQQAFLDLGISLLVQDNYSFSLPHVLRGLHFQTNPWQGKWVTVVEGSIFDVAVDLRKDSLTFGEHYGIVLSAVNCLGMWIPAGFAHGFCVMGDKPAGVYYKVDQRYDAASEKGILWSDPRLGIDWPLAALPIVSEKDAQLPDFKTAVQALYPML